MLANRLVMPDRESRTSLADIPNRPDISVLDTSFRSVLSHFLETKVCFSMSEYFPSLAPGERVLGIAHQDVKHLSIPDATLDFVITSEVMEHVDSPWVGFVEIYRVLKPGGYHLFTTPCDFTQPTRTRAVLEGGLVRHILSPVYHRDPMSPRGALVFTDFGSDLAARLESIGFSTEVIVRTDTQFGFDKTTAFASKKSIGSP
jgi:SAM-dependent methyltransferase